MKTYIIIRDIIFFILGLLILGTCIYTAKMVDIIDSNIVYVNRKIPRDIDERLGHKKLPYFELKEEIKPEDLCETIDFENKKIVK